MQFLLNYMLVIIALHQCIAQAKLEEAINENSKRAIDDVLKKINEFSVQSFANAPYSAKLEMLRKVEEKLRKAVKSMDKKGERYVNLIIRGIKARIFNENSHNKTSRIQLKIPMNHTNNFNKAEEKMKIINGDSITETLTKTYDDTQVITQDFRGASDKNIFNQHIKKGIYSDDEDFDENVDDVLKEHLRRINVLNNERKYDYSKNDSVVDTITETFVQSFTPRYECESNLDRICLNIKQMRQSKCQFGDSAIPIEKLCDGFSDCPYRTDEKFCKSQVTERMQNAIQVIHKTDKSFQLGCVPNKTKESVLTSQVIVLCSVLQAQQAFVEKYKYFNWSLIPNSDPNKGEGTVKGAVKEIALIISTLAFALDAELCSKRRIGEEFTARKFNDLLTENFGNVIDEVELPPKSCTCKGEFCENITVCNEDCKRVCWQKYSLSRWGCPSINGTENVPLNVICDGKFDCFDQSDEKGCVTGITFAKFEAHEIFKEVLTSLSLKVMSKEYLFIRNMLLSLRRTIEYLQKSSMASDPDLDVIRTLRNECFSALSTIYSETLSKSTFYHETSEMYEFLLFLNENIVNALKRCHTGNKRIISNDGCYCRNGKCAMPICSRKCERSCVAEPWLTRYACKNSFNKSVSLEDICNGKANCPSEDDETHCQKEICRRHHLNVLRNSLQKIGKKQEGTSMGELLATWKIKVSSTLLIAENNGWHNPNTIREIIRDILNDLVITYGAVKDYRRNNNYGLEEFTHIARFVMKFLRSCGY